ncbi:structural maintenance of chromosomes 6 [Brevipalpus obovatus]|uniref:structural maintenance of chromosomes 6 n=1 Tax=Brevipalpus obovatus TaxID=246614 RepID=UPI003D9E1AE9
MASNKRRRRASSLSNGSSKENIDNTVSQTNGHDYDDVLSSDRSEDERDFRRNIKLHSTQREKTFLKDSALVDSTIDQGTQSDEESQDSDMDPFSRENFGNGTVVSVSLINFMCHERFEITFGPRVNFVVGRNGSGKSAILTAIVLALGGRASNTSRGNSMKTFVRTGAQTAKIILKLRNSNTDDVSPPFKSETYGDVIVIERTFKKDGGSSYSLKSQNNRLVSNKKEELDSMVRHFNIQIDNPITILNQEVSRNFLNSKNPRDKYKFFMKATTLETIRNDYQMAAEKCGLARIELKKKNHLVKEIKKELDELEKKLQMFKKLEESESKIAVLKKELVWAEIGEKKARLSSLEEDVENKQKRLDELSTAMKSYEDKIVTHEKEKKEVESKLDGLGGNLSEIQAQVDEKKSLLMSLKQKKQELQSETRKREIDIHSTQSDEIALKKKIENLRAKYSDISNEEQQRQDRINKISSLEDEHKDVDSELKTRRLDSEQLNSSIGFLQEQISTLSSDIRDLESRIAQKTAEARNLNQSRSNNLKRFGAFMPDLVKRIEEEYKKGNFRQKPLGPIGAYLKLLNPEAALAVENTLKNTITSFCCDNTSDSTHLQRVFSSVIGSGGFHPSIITRRFAQRHNIEKNRLRSSKYSSIYELLEIENDCVANVLIDRCNIESVAYFPTHREALDVMTEPSLVPENCTQGYTKEGTNFYPRRNANEGIRQYPSERKQAAYFSRDIGTIIDTIEREIRDSTKQIDEKKKAMETFRKTYSENKHDRDEASRRLRELQERKVAIESELRKLKSVTEETNVEIAVFEEELSSIMSRKHGIQEKIRQIEEKLQELDLKIEDSDREYKELLRQRSDSTMGRQPLEEQISLISERVNKTRRYMEKIDLQLSSLKSSIDKVEENAQKIQKELESMEEKALELTEQPIETERKVQQIKTEIEEIEKIQREQSANMGDRHKISKEFRKKSARHDHTLRNVEAAKNLVANTDASAKYRLRKFMNFRDSLTQRVCEIFKLSLETLNFTGELNISHENQVLEIKINPKSQHGELYKDTRSLSGGERSFGTVAFLIALWEACDSPFRILDEVDVFMDVVTRSTAVQILVENAKSNSSRQYMFLSPLGMVISEEDNFQIHHMPEPLRGA